VLFSIIFKKDLNINKLKKYKVHYIVFILTEPNQMYSYDFLIIRAEFIKQIQMDIGLL